MFKSIISFLEPFFFNLLLQDGKAVCLDLYSVPARNSMNLYIWCSIKKTAIRVLDQNPTKFNPKRILTRIHPLILAFVVATGLMSLLLLFYLFIYRTESHRNSSSIRGFRQTQVPEPKYFKEILRKKSFS